MFRNITLKLILFTALMLFATIGLTQEKKEIESEIAVGKLIVAKCRQEAAHVAFDIFNDVKDLDKSGDSYFLMALILIKWGEYDDAVVMGYLETAKNKNNAMSIALLYKMYSEPYILAKKNKQVSMDLKSLYQNLVLNGSIKADFDLAMRTVDYLLTNCKS